MINSNLYKNLEVSIIFIKIGHVSIFKNKKKGNEYTDPLSSNPMSRYNIEIYFWDDKFP